MKRFSLKWPKGRIITVTLLGGVVLVWVGGKLLDLALPYIVDIQAIQTQIQTAIRKGTGIQLATQELDIHPTLLNGIEVVLRSSVLSDPKSIRLVNIERMSIHLRYWPLLTQGKKEVSKIHFDHMTTYLDENSFFFHLKLPPEEKKKEVEFKNTEILLTNYVVIANHSLEKKHQYQLSGERLALKHLYSTKPLGVEGKGSLFLMADADHRLMPIGEVNFKSAVAPEILKAKKFQPALLQDLNLDVTNLHLIPVGQVAGSYGLVLQPKRPDQLDLLHVAFHRLSPTTGQLQANINSHQDLQFKLDGSRFALTPGEITLKSDLHNFNQFENLHLAVAGQNFDVRTQGSIHLAQPLEKSRLDLTTNTSQFPVEMLQFLPQSLPISSMFQRLKGQAKVNAVRLQGPLMAPTLSVADLQFQDIALQGRNQQGRTPVLRGLNGRFQLQDKRIRLQNLTGILGNAPFAVNATVLPEEQTLEGSVQAQALPLDQATVLAHELSQALSIALPAEIQRFGLDGTTDIHATVSGRLTQPLLHGQVTLHQVALLPSRALNSPILNHINGTFFLEGNQVRLPGLVAYLNGNRFHLTGRFNTLSQQLRAQLTGQGVNLGALQGSAQRISHILDIPVPALDQVRISGFSNVLLNLTGALSNPTITGNARLYDGHLVYLPENLTIERVRGTIGITPTQYNLNALHGQIGSNGMDIAGHIDKDFKDYRLALTGKNIDIPTARREIFAKLPQTQALAQQMAGLSGSADLALVATPGRTAPQVNGNIVVNRFVFKNPQLPYPVSMGRLVLHLRNSMEVIIPRTRGALGPIAFALEGNARQAQYNFRVTTDKIPVAFLRDHRAALAPILASAPPLPEFWNTAGSFAATLNLQPKNTAGALSFYDAGASWANAAFPLYHLNGTVTFNTSPLKVHSDQVAFHYGNSDVTTSLDYSPNGKLAFNSKGTLSPLLLNHLLIPPDSPNYVVSRAPFNIQMAGAVRSFEPGGAGNNLDSRIQFDITDGLKATDLQTVGEKAPGTPDAHVQTAFHLKKDQLILDDTVVNLFDSGTLMLKGSVNKIFSQSDRQFSLQMLTDPVLDLAKLDGILPHEQFEKLSGTLAADLTIEKTGEAEGIANGFLDLRNLSIPLLDIQNLTGKATFAGQGAQFDIATFKIPGVNVGLRATAENVLEIPIALENVQIDGSQFNIADFTQFTNEVVANKIQKQLIEKLFGPTLIGAPVIPVEFHNGTVAIQEVIYQNILLNDFKGLLSLYPNSFLELNDMNFHSTGGAVTGSLSMNPQDNNFLTVNLDLANVKANPLAIALLNLPNNIFGNLNGSIRFTTQGTTDTEMINNTNGTANLSIRNGRLPALTKIETLLTAVNILRGGVLGLNLNNLLRTLDPLQTNYFAELSGNFQIAEGVIHTNDLLSDGVNLDLLIQGQIRMIDGVANLNVTGSMNQTVSGVLGPLGKLSVSRLVQYVPGLGYLPGSTKQGGLLSYIPGVGYIPGFGGPAGQLNRFRIKIQGPLEDPSSAKDLEWLP